MRSKKAFKSSVEIHMYIFSALIVPYRSMKKLAFKQGTECPKFNETLTFDLYLNELDTTTFLLPLCTRTLGGNSIGQTSRKLRIDVWERWI